MEKQQAISQNMMALARRRGKKRGGARSQMLRMIMPMLSRENGEKLAKAIDERNSGQFRTVWDKIKKQVEEKLDAEATANGEQPTVEEVYDELAKEIGEGVNKEDLEVKASNQDYSRLITGSAKIPKMTREIVANGRIELKNKSGEEFTVIINDVVVPSNPNTSKNPQMKVEAEIYRANEKKRMHKLEFKGEYAAACSEIVVNAMSMIEE